MDHEAAILEGKHQLTPFQHHSELISEDRKQNLSRQRLLEGVPVDVEEGSVGRGRAIFEDVHPPAVARLSDPHVVGDDVEDVAERVRAQRRRQGVVVGLLTQFGIQVRMIGNVIPVHAPRPRLQIGRSIQIRYPQLM